MHLTIEVVRQPAIVVEPAEVCAADVADLQLLVARGPAGVGEGLEVSLALLLGLLGLADLEVLLDGARDAPFLGQDGDLEQACVDGLGDVGDLLQQRVRLPDLVGRLLEPALRRVDPAVALVDVLLHVAHVVVLEPELGLFLAVEPLPFALERLAVHFWAGSEVLLCVGEEVVGAGANDKGAANAGVAEGDLGGAGAAGAHELVWGDLSVGFTYRLGGRQGRVIPPMSCSIEKHLLAIEDGTMGTVGSGHT